jgi:hypothetical protein
VRTVYKFWTGLLVLGVLTQIGFAGVGAFHAAKEIDDHSSIGEDGFQSWFDPHVALGYFLFLGAVLLVVFAAIGARDRLKWSAIALGLFVAQILLAWVGFAAPALGFLHPLNALLILGTVGTLAHREWRPAAAPQARTM